MTNIAVNSLTIDEPRLPTIERADLDKGYPLDAPVPRLLWRVSLQCGDYGGSYGQGYTLREALEYTAKKGWTPVRSMTVTLRADRYDMRLRTVMALEYVVERNLAWRGAQRFCDAACKTARAITVPHIETDIARLRSANG